MRYPRLAVVLLAALYGAACSPAPQQPEIVLPEGPGDWIIEVVRAPTSFAALLDTTGADGWIALHRNDLRASREGFASEPEAGQLARARVEWSLHLLYGDLSRASDHAHLAFLSSWAARELPVTPGIRTLSAQWRACGGLDAVGVEQPDKLPPVFKTEVALPDAVAARAAAHEQARSGAFGDLYRVASAPWITETDTEFERVLYDPCVFRSLEAGWMRQAHTSTGAEGWKEVAGRFAGAGLEGRLFAPWLTSADLTAELARQEAPGTLGASQPSLAQFGIGPEMSVQDDVEVAREDVRALDAVLDRREKALAAEADDDGKALLKDLGLHQRFRQEWITARARKALLEGRPHQAMAYLELARDVSTRAVGPANAPSALALYAEAQIRLGRTREALDVLVVLEQAHPEVAALRELAGDLAILQGLDRQGDSKEN